MNKKGTTLIELIVTITLISLILLFLFKIILTLSNDNNLSKEDIEILSIKNAVTKEVEDCYIKNGKNNCNFTLDDSSTLEISDTENLTVYKSFIILTNTYTLPDGYYYYFIKDDSDSDSDSDRNIYKDTIKIRSANEELDDRFTIKLYYYDKNS